MKYAEHRRRTMKKNIFLILLFSIILLIQTGTAEISCLSHIFLLGRGIKDMDGDSLGDTVSLRIIIPDRPTSREIALAADIAARANLESLALDFSLIVRESEIRDIREIENPIFIGDNIKILKEWMKESRPGLLPLGSHQGLVLLFSEGNKRGIGLAAGSEDALLKTGRAFFLRWPYFWEIWGREDGVTYFTFEKDLDEFFDREGIQPQGKVIRAALYEFLPLESAHETIKRLDFNSGEIQTLFVEIKFAGEREKEKAYEALNSLKSMHRQGLRTDTLSYSGCSQMTFVLHGGREERTITVPRVGHPRRLLTPSYKAPGRRNIPEKDFDLLSMFSAKGFFADTDKDGILDALETSIIISPGSNSSGTGLLATRLTLPTAGASFPLVYLDDEVEDKKALTAPLLVGPSSLTDELLKTGKLKIPSLESGWGIVQVVQKAFNKTNALSIIAADEPGMEKTLRYLGQTFPYFEDYREGNPGCEDVLGDMEKFLQGEKGSAEAYLVRNLKKIVEDIKDKDLASFQAEFYLPEENRPFEKEISEYLKITLPTENIEIQNYSLRENKKIFEKEQEFGWEGDDALALIEEKIKILEGNRERPLTICLGLSESPDVREKIKARAEEILRKHGIPAHDLRVLSAYKQGFFWLTEQVFPVLADKNISRLTIKFAEEKENRSQPKRFYADSYRWLQELYPVDDIASIFLKIPLEKIQFEMKEGTDPVYEVHAFDDHDRLLYEGSFSPRRRNAPYLSVLPEWGNVTVTSGWLEIRRGEEVICDSLIKGDLEKFWNFYQEDVLSPVYSHIMKKTGNEPSTSKQPYFKKLQVELWASEPDYKLGLDEEIVSSLESIHDEIYFDTLDFLRGITEVEVEEKDTPEDTSRLSAPGNILPVIHPSQEGQKGRVRVTLEDWPASSPQLLLKWKVKGREEEFTKKITFPKMKSKSVRMPSFIYNGRTERIEILSFEVELENEADYLSLLDIIETYRELQSKSLLAFPFSYPRLHSLSLKLKWKELEKEESFPILSKVAKVPEGTSEPSEIPVPTDEIISHEMCIKLVRSLGQNEKVKAYIAGKSYENRDVPVLEIFTPQAKYVSTARLTTFKPTLYLSGRQHANEVSSTNYILKFAELLAKDKDYGDVSKKINFVLHPMENPDGAALAYELQKLTPFHCLHAGRYSLLGMDIGTQVSSTKPLLPEAMVRKNINEKWRPDIYLNLHGYPSHEWVQQFSNYSPYLFRDYWIPRGWFAYFRSLRLPIYQRWKEAGDDVKKFLIDEMQANPEIADSNRKFYDRYRRWAARWQPHMNDLEITDGLNIYAKRRSSEESKLTPRTQVTFVEETPELMDETARGDWLRFLCEQGLTYLNAHVRYLSSVHYEISRIDEEIRDRIRIQFIRSRPGSIKKKE